MTARSLVIKITAGKDDPERCNQGFNVAAAAVASGVTTSLWLTGEASWFALPGRAEDFSLPHAPPLGDLLASVLASGIGDAVHPVRGAAEHHPAGHHRGRAHRGRGHVRGRGVRRRRAGARLLSRRVSLG